MPSLIQICKPESSQHLPTGDRCIFKKIFVFFYLLSSVTKELFKNAVCSLGRLQIALECNWRYAVTQY